MLVSHMDTSMTFGCSISDLVSWQCVWESSEGWPKYRATADLHEAPSLSPAQPWPLQSSGEESRGWKISFCNSVFQIDKIVNKKKERKGRKKKEASKQASVGRKEHCFCYRLCSWLFHHGCGFCQCCWHYLDLKLVVLWPGNSIPF